MRYYETMIVEERESQLRIYNIRNRSYDYYNVGELELIVKDYNECGWNIVPYPDKNVLLAMSRKVED